ncbi:MAG: exosortase-dependent surface protein XDP1 [Ferribacterium limneticum]
MKNQYKVLGGLLVWMVAGHVSASTEWSIKVPAAGLTVSAFSNTGGANTESNLADGGVSQTIETATLNVYDGGVGVKNNDAYTSGATYWDNKETAEPEHAIDNNQRYDMVLLSFADMVKLESVNLGYVNTDSDLTVMRFALTKADGSQYAASDVKNGLLSGITYSSLADNGWEVVGHYTGTNSTGSRGVNSQELYSSYWLIGAYNPLVGSTDKVFGVGGVDRNNDYFKLNTVIASACTSQCGSTTNVPEPNSIALMLVGLVGLSRFLRARV